MYLSSSLTNLPNGLATCSALACSLDHYTCLFDHSLFARSYTRLYLIVRSLAGFACSLARWFEFTSLLALPYLPRSLVSVRLIARPCLRWLSHWSSTLRMHVSMLSIVSHRCMSFPLARAAALVCLHTCLSNLIVPSLYLCSPRCYIGMSAIQGATLLYVLRTAILC
jgi:hypothetical protein